MRTEEISRSIVGVRGRVVRVEIWTGSLGYPGFFSVSVSASDNLVSRAIHQFDLHLAGKEL